MLSSTPFRAFPSMSSTQSFMNKIGIGVTTKLSLFFVFSGSSNIVKHFFLIASMVLGLGDHLQIFLQLYLIGLLGLLADLGPLKL